MNGVDQKRVQLSYLQQCALLIDGCSAGEAWWCLRGNTGDDTAVVQNWGKWDFHAQVRSMNRAGNQGAQG